VPFRFVALTVVAFIVVVDMVVVFVVPAVLVTAKILERVIVLIVADPPVMLLVRTDCDDRAFVISVGVDTRIELGFQSFDVCSDDTVPVDVLTLLTS
jgi:hypothetical protein